MISLHRSRPTSRGSRILNALAAKAGMARLALRRRAMRPSRSRGPVARILHRS
jgi:hypothetical protein